MSPFQLPTWGSASDGYAWQYTFQGGRYDPVTGLIHFDYRDYDPKLGTWSQQDPAGAQFVDGMNLYAAFDDGPAQKIDPYGLDASGFQGARPTPPDYDQHPEKYVPQRRKPPKHILLPTTRHITIKCNDPIPVIVRALEIGDDGKVLLGTDPLDYAERANDVLITARAVHGTGRLKLEKHYWPTVRDINGKNPHNPPAYDSNNSRYGEVGYRITGLKAGDSQLIYTDEYGGRVVIDITCECPTTAPAGAPTPPSTKPAK